jgi:hypothetical protein
LDLCACNDPFHARTVARRDLRWCPSLNASVRGEEETKGVQRAKQWSTRMFTSQEGFNGKQCHLMVKNLRTYICPLTRVLHVTRASRHFKLLHCSRRGESRHTCTPFGERYVTSRFLLNKFDLDLSSSGLLVFGLFLIDVVVAGTISSVIAYGRGACRRRWRMLVIWD